MIVKGFRISIKMKLKHRQVATKIISYLIRWGWKNHKNLNRFCTQDFFEMALNSHSAVKKWKPKTIGDSFFMQGLHKKHHRTCLWQRSLCMATKSLCSTTKTWCSQINNWILKKINIIENYSQQILIQMKSLDPTTKHLWNIHSMF